MELISCFWQPLIDDKLDFFKLVEKYVPDADKPSWVNKDGVMTIGDVSPACQKVFTHEYVLSYSPDLRYC